MGKLLEGVKKMLKSKAFCGKCFDKIFMARQKRLLSFIWCWSHIIHFGRKYMYMNAPAQKQKVLMLNQKRSFRLMFSVCAALIYAKHPFHNRGALLRADSYAFMLCLKFFFLLLLFLFLLSWLFVWPTKKNVIKQIKKQNDDVFVLRQKTPHRVDVLKAALFEHIVFALHEVDSRCQTFAIPSSSFVMNNITLLQFTYGGLAMVSIQTAGRGIVKLNFERFGIDF